MSPHGWIIEATGIVYRFNYAIVRMLKPINKPKHQVPYYCLASFYI